MTDYLHEVHIKQLRMKAAFMREYESSRERIEDLIQEFDLDVSLDEIIAAVALKENKDKVDNIHITQISPRYDPDQDKHYLAVIYDRLTPLGVYKNEVPLHSLKLPALERDTFEPFGLEELEARGIDLTRLQRGLARMYGVASRELSIESIGIRNGSGIPIVEYSRYSPKNMRVDKIALGEIASEK